MAESVEIQQQTVEQINQEFPLPQLPPLPADVVVYAVEGPFFFAAVELFRKTLAATHTDPRISVIRLRWVPFIDITGLQTLEELIIDLHQRGVRVILAGARPRVEAKLHKSGILLQLGPQNVFNDFSEALHACHIEVNA